MITTVIQWENGMVMVFDENGHQIPEYQGRVEEVRDKIRKDAPEVQWEHLNWNNRRI